MSCTCGLYNKAVKDPHVHQKFCQYSKCIISEVDDGKQFKIVHCIYLKGVS